MLVGHVGDDGLAHTGADGEADVYALRHDHHAPVRLRVLADYLALGDLGVYGVVDLEVEELFKLGAVHYVLIAVADEVGYVYPLRDAEDVAQPVVPEENKDRN